MGCSVKSSNLKVNIPEEPAYAETIPQFYPCYSVPAGIEGDTSFDEAASPAYCISPDDLDSFFTNILKLDTYKDKLKELLKGATR